MLRITVITLLTVAGGAAYAESPLETQLSVGAFLSSGDFDETDSTDVLVAPFALRLGKGPWSIRATAPYVSVRGPGNVTVVVDDEGGGRGSGGSGSGSRGSGSGSGSNTGSGSSGRGGADPSEPRTTPATTTSSGFGDTSIAGTYAFDQLGGSSVYLDVTARVRLPTGDEDRGLGVGATDYALLGELGYETATGGAYVSVGRRFLGSLAGVERVDGWQAGAGAWVSVTDSVELGTFYSQRDASTRAGEDLEEAGLYITTWVNDSFAVELSGSAGLSDADADYEVGLMLTWRSSR